MVGGCSCEGAGAGREGRGGLKLASRHCFAELFWTWMFPGRAWAICGLQPRKLAACRRTRGGARSAYKTQGPQARRCASGGDRRVHCHTCMGQQAPPASLAQASGCSTHCASQQAVQEFVLGRWQGSCVRDRCVGLDRGELDSVAVPRGRGRGRGRGQGAGWMFADGRRGRRLAARCGRR